MEKQVERIEMMSEQARERVVEQVKETGGAGGAVPAIACFGFKAFLVIGAGKSEEDDDLAPVVVDLRIVVVFISGFPSFFLRAFLRLSRISK